MDDPARDDLLILVDGLDRAIGTATKEQAHVEGMLHRAFSVVFVREGASGKEVLLAQRAHGKYHSGGKWANSCCSHPRDGEELLAAARRRVGEELGCRAHGLREIGAFVYRAPFSNGLVEYEYDHVLVGECVGALDPDPSEVGGTRWIGLDALAQELATNPLQFAPWAFTVLSLAIRNESLGE